MLREAPRVIDGIRILIHEPTRTLVRCTGGQVQITREGREIASVNGSSTNSTELGLAEDGTLFVGDQGFLDLRDPEPRCRDWSGVASFACKTLHPNGAIALVLTRAPADDPASSEAVREFHERVRPDTFQLVTLSTTGQLETLAEGSAVAEPGGRAFQYLTHPVFAPDGKHWAILVGESLDDEPYRDRRVILGRSDRVVAHHRIDFSPEVWRASFDLKRGVFLLTGKLSLLAMSLEDGRVMAERSLPEPSDSRGVGGLVRSALVPVPGGLVAVIAEEREAFYALHEFDVTTLASRGRWAGVAPLHDAHGRFALAPLPANSSGEAAGIVWAPAVHPLVLIYASESWHEGPLVRREVPESPKTRSFEPSQETDLARASPEDRVALAGELLERRERNPLFIPLVRAWPESFHPHLARVLDWPSEWKAMLEQLDGRRWPAIARGASDPLVDVMAETVRRLGGQAIELDLLLAADTPRALVRLAELAREIPHVREVANRKGCLEIPVNGPAVRRFDPNERVLRAVPRSTAPRAGALELETRLEPEAWLEEPRGLTCLQPPTHLVRVPLELVHCEPSERLKAFHFGLSSCARGGSACDEWLAIYEAHAGSRPGRLQLVSDLLEHEEMMDPGECCQGAEEKLPEPKRVELSPFELDDSRTVLGSIGGRPEWVQGPEIPSCPECERAMFFVGQIETLWLDVSFVELFGFVCERCAITVQVRQNS